MVVIPLRRQYTNYYIRSERLEIGHAGAQPFDEHYNTLHYLYLHCQPNITQAIIVPDG